MLAPYVPQVCHDALRDSCSYVCLLGRNAVRSVQARGDDMVVKRIQGGGNAKKAGGVSVGMKIVEVNGISTKGQSKQRVLDLMNIGGSSCKIRFVLDSMTPPETVAVAGVDGPAKQTPEKRPSIVFGFGDTPMMYLTHGSAG